MPWETPSFTYRAPVDLALELVEKLGQSWSNLPAGAQDELGGLLAQLRLSLVQAAGNASADVATAVFQGDRLRAIALVGFLYACERSDSLPSELKTQLAGKHKGGGHTLTVSKEKARQIVAAVDFVVPQPFAAPSPEPASPETYSNPLERAQKLTRWLTQHWTVLSIEAEDAVADAMVNFGIELENAQGDAEAEGAAQDFLAAIKAIAPVYQEVAGSVVYRDLGGGLGSNAGAEARQKILASLQQHPVVGPALESSHRSAESTPESVADEIAPPSIAPDAGQAAGDSAVAFHTAVDFPAEVTVFDKRIPLIVQLTLDKPVDTQADATVTVAFTAEATTEQVLVVCDAQDFEHERGANTRLIEVYRAQDSQLAVFLLTPQENASPGAKRISLDFYHRGRLAGSAVFQTLLKDRPPLPKPDEKASTLALFGVEQRLILATPVADAPDFVLRVALGVDANLGARRLSFTLDSPKGLLGYRHQPMGSVTLAEEPRRFLENKIIDLSMKARSNAADREEEETQSFQQDIAKIGWDLYEQLFPAQLKAAWPKLQAMGAPGSLSMLLISEEPWIPWELVNTPDPAGAFHLDGFLCQQFRMTRWLAGPGLPDQFTLDSAQLIAPAKTDLDSVKKEKAFFASLRSEAPAIQVTKDPLETADQVEQAFSQQRTRLYHFACHGEFEPGDPDSSGLLLTGDALRPSDIVGPARAGIQANQPMVFLNACSSAEADLGLSRVGGWAQRFVSAGATAFVGSLWEVNDVLAADFAVAFYRQLLAGKMLGEAFYQARQAIKRQDPANPTWLAYVLYAHPNGKVTIGG